MFDNLRNDLRYSLRSLAARPGFLTAILLTLALGIGANAAIFSVLNGALLRPLPFPHAERLVDVFNRYPQMGLEHAGTSIPDYLDRRAAPGLEGLAIYTSDGLSFVSEGVPQQVLASRNSASLFEVLGVAPLLGRSFAAADVDAGKDDELILSYGAWQAWFDRDPAVLGRNLTLSGKRYVVIGVMPRGFFFPNRETQVWTPFVFTPEQREDLQRGNEFSSSIGLVRPGVGIEQLDAQFAAIIARNAERIATIDQPGAGDFATFLRSGAFEGRARWLREQWLGDLSKTLLLLQGATLLVLLIACANVANLLLSRALGRRRELTVRGALGAGRGRLIAQQLSESLLLALIGGALGLVLAYSLTGALAAALGFDQERGRFEFGLDASVLGFTALLIALTGLVFGLAPVLAQSRMRPYEVLKEITRGGSEGQGARALRRGLVVLQTSLAIVLLVGAGLLLKSFSKLSGVDPGFDAAGLITAPIQIPVERYPEGPKRVQFYERVLEAVRATPGIERAGYITGLPFTDQFWTASYTIEGREVAPGASNPHGHYRVVDEGYFETAGITLLEGRNFAPSDSADAERVVIIDELLARKHFPDREAIGQRIGFDSDDPAVPDDFWTIIGVVETINQSDLSKTPEKETYYRYLRQAPATLGAIVVRSNLSGESVASALRTAVLRVDPEQPLYDIRTLDDRVRTSLDTRRAPMHLLLAFAGLALMLAAVGIYGVLAFLVTSRTGEIGIRMAIGAQPRRVLAETLRQGAWLTGAGLVLGVFAALWLGRFLEAQLFGVSRFDPSIFIAVALVLGLVALAACWLPARRAASIAPTEALRHQ
jgi:predicted permease